MAVLSRVIMEPFDKKSVQHREAVRTIEERLRPIDRLEVEGVGMTVQKCAYHPDCDNWLVTARDGTPLCVFGVSRGRHGDMGHAVWMLAAVDVTRYKKELIRIGTSVLRHYAAIYGQVYNVISIKNNQSRRWLAAAGAVFYEPFTANNERWQAFTIKGSEKHVRSTVDDGTDGAAGDTAI